jgi:hypothetical protein
MPVKHFGDRIVEDLMQAGESWKRDVTPADVDPQQLAAGINVEFEHTRDPIMSTKITLDHLAEHVKPSDDFARYYTGLSLLEQILRSGRLDLLIAWAEKLGMRPKLKSLAPRHWEAVARFVEQRR